MRSSLALLNMGLAVELEVPKMSIIGLHYPLSWSNRFCGERGKINYLVTWQINIVLIIFIFLGQKLP
jgi:hypothetical protein